MLPGWDTHECVRDCPEAFLGTFEIVLKVRWMSRHNEGTSHKKDTSIMRKKLLFCSALLLSASLAGCGYNDDNVRETVIALPETCSSTNECVSGTVSGQCVENHCLRYCEDRSDCEDGTICESGLCRHIEPCPTMDYEDGFEKYKNKKCLKVFAHTPATNWVSLLTQDVRVTSVSGRNASTNFTSKNFTFQVPNRALKGGLNYALVVASSLTFIVLENMTSTLFMKCVMPTGYLGEEENIDESKYRIDMDKTKAGDLALTDGSLYRICKEIHERPNWNNDLKNKSDTLCSDSHSYYHRFTSSGRKNILNLTDNTSSSQESDRLRANDCERTLLALQTLQKVYGVIAQATLNQEQASKTSTYQVGTWILDLLDDGKTTKKHSIEIQIPNDFVPEDTTLVDGKYTAILPEINTCNDLVSEMQSIQSNICYYLMNGIQDNPMSQILGKAGMDLVTCLMSDNTAPSLIKNGWTLVDKMAKAQSADTPDEEKIKHTLPGIAMSLMAVLSLHDEDLASSFSSMTAMVNALGDPTFIWLTENNIQELNILSDQTNNNPFKENELMLTINYAPQSAAITNNGLSLDVYDTNNVTHNEKDVPDLAATSKRIGSNPFQTVEGLHTAALLSRTGNTGKYEFYLNPKLASGTNLTCGGVTLDISTIGGYVVLTDDQINDMQGTALVIDHDTAHHHH